MKKFSVLLCSTAVFVPAAAFAQSTGSVEFEKQTIVITGTKQRAVGGVETPQTPKAKVVLNQEIISRQNPGQTILDTINLVPGVSFQNNDPYGSSGGTLTIRGFDSTRISLTFDGIQLNDSGNYAIFSNQQLDPELIENVNVNLGSTDVDSPTASAVGGTVNIREMIPTEKMGGRIVGSLGSWDYRRIFGVFNTGAIGPFGTRLFIAASKADNRVPFNNYGKIDKQQYNARIWQPIGSNGDFVSVTGHYNQNRNNFFGSLPLRTDLTRSATDLRPRIVGPNTQNRYPTNRDERFYNINFPCQVAAARPGVADAPGTSVGPGANDPNGDFATCGTEFDRRYNPSNTGNIRGSSRFTLADGVVLTVDPSYQYVKANGGGTVTANESLFDVNPAGGRANCRTTANGPQVSCQTGFIGGTPFFGRDVNGDGDTLDTVTVLAPSQTHTDRYGVIAGLRWDINHNHAIRVGYTLDYARHRQTGEVGLLNINGEPLDVFPINNPQADAAANVLEKRDRLSYAILNQVAGEYRGIFGPVTLNVGLRAPFFERKLHNYCFTTSSSGFVDCFGSNTAAAAAYAAANPTIQGPQKRDFKYNKLLPNIGAIFNATSSVSVFANYAKGLSVPSTDNLYNSFFFPANTTAARPKPETTDSVDGGVRYRTGKIQAQLSGWYTKFKNREAQAFDPELNQSVFRNLGTVAKWGIDGSVAYTPVRALTLYAFGSWMRSKIQDNIQIGSFGSGANQVTNCDSIPAGATQADIIRSCAFTRGKYESGVPKYTYGASAVGHLGDFDLGVTAKRTGPRFIFDNNQAVFRGDIGITTPTAGRVVQEQVFGRQAPAYWLVNLDARYSLRSWGPQLKNTYLQLNVYNLFDKFFVGGFGGGLNQAFSTRTCNATSTPSCVPTVTVPTWGNPPFVQIGAPRAILGSVNIGF